MDRVRYLRYQNGWTGGWSGGRLELGTRVVKMGGVGQPGIQELALSHLVDRKRLEGDELEFRNCSCQNGWTGG